MLCDLCAANIRHSSVDMECTFPKLRRSSPLAVSNDCSRTQNKSDASLASPDLERQSWVLSKSSKTAQSHNTCLYPAKPVSHISEELKREGGLGYPLPPSKATSEHIRGTFLRRTKNSIPQLRGNSASDRRQERLWLVEQRAGIVSECACFS